MYRYGVITALGRVDLGSDRRREAKRETHSFGRLCKYSDRKDDLGAKL
jgi:hypothetical protein